MNRTIFTQTGNFINYDYVIAIKSYSGETDENIKAVQIVALIDGTESETADGTNEIILGIYEENYSGKVFELLKKWLNEKNDFYHLFVMPDNFSE